MNDELKKTSQLEEPSVLDYVKSLLRFGGAKRIQIPSFVEEEQDKSQPARPILTQPEELFVDSIEPKFYPAGQAQTELSDQHSPTLAPEPPVREMQVPFTLAPSTPFPWRSLLAFGLALIAQQTLEPPHTSAGLGVAIYIAAFSALGWALYHGEWTLPSIKPTSDRIDPLTYRTIPLLVSLVLGLVGFFILTDNLFTKLNVTVWVLAVVFLIWAFWLNRNGLRVTARHLKSLFQREAWTVNISHWTVLLLAATMLIFFFRFYRTASVPPEPFSDHAEKILDVYDISQGQTHIFFPRNTGREGFQMYWTLLIAKVFGTGLSFLSLKLGTAILGFLTLPFVYLLGKEVGGPRVGFFAFFLTGIGYWPNVISRVGLRFPLYPLFAAPTLLYLIRGLRTHNRNDFLLSGLFLGIGLHGYSPIRIVPFVIVAAFALYWLHSLRSQSQGARKDLPIWLVMLALVATFVFLPLLRYWVDNPTTFNSRVFTRLSSVEQPLPGPAYQVFFSNLWNGLRMFNYDDGETWVNSVTHRPALDVISAALFLIGVVLILIRYIRNRHWLDAFLLVSVPLLQMPSILSLAFPGENPALNRAGGAYVPAFIIAAVALDGLLTSIGRGTPALSKVVTTRSVLMWGLAGILFFFSARQNYDLVFNQYYTSFRDASWNTSDIGKVISGFAEISGTTDTAWVVPFPYWVDTRLTAMWVGIPNRDMAMWRDNLASTLELKGPKLFIVKADLENPDGNDQASLDVLKSLYPNGQLRMFDSDVPGHDFWIFTVPNQ